MTVVHPQWDARQPLQDSPSWLDRRVGVAVGHPYHHHGLGAVYVDIDRDTVTVNTASSGGRYPVAETARQVRVAFEETIRDLDKVIAHLTAHRDRLVAELTSVAGRDFEESVSSRSAPTVVDVALPAGGAAS